MLAAMDRSYPLSETALGALLNTSQLERKTWFLVLLILGIFNFGILGMIAYVIAGPDGTAGGFRHPAAVPAAA